MNPNRLLVLYAHAAPHLSRVNRRLADAALLSDGVYLRDLYETYPDFYIDVPREQALVAQAEVLVFLHPLQWYSMPALMKEWIDTVLVEGWAYGAGSTGGGALQGKRYWLVATTGGGADEFAFGARHGRPFADYLAPFRQTAALCGMEWLEPHILHGAHAVGAAMVDAHVEAFSEQLRRLAAATARPLIDPGPGLNLGHGPGHGPGQLAGGADGN
jgi:glutathione-regulated potassium-efflux system ancillary protein KefF